MLSAGVAGPGGGPVRGAVWRGLTLADPEPAVALLFRLHQHREHPVQIPSPTYDPVPQKNPVSCPEPRGSTGQHADTPQTQTPLCWAPSLKHGLDGNTPGDPAPSSAVTWQ